MRQAAVKPQNALNSIAPSEQKELGLAPKDLSVASAVPLDLRPLIAPYRSDRRLTLRVEELPQQARLSAGRNNGDQSWSLTLDELEGLSFIPPKGSSRQYFLKLRLMVRDEAEVSTVALIEFSVTNNEICENRANIRTYGAASTSQSAQPLVALHEKIASLEAALSTRNGELNDLIASNEHIRAQAEQTVSQTLAEAESGWKAQETHRLNSELQALQSRYECELTELRSNAQTNEKEAADLRDTIFQLRREQEVTQGTLSQIGASREQLESQLQVLQKDHLVEIAAAKEEAARDAAEKLRVLENKWQERMARSLAEQAVGATNEITARCQAAEEALATAQNRQANIATANEDYVRQLNGEIASMRKTFVDREAELTRTHEREAAQFRDAMVRLSGELGIVQDALSEREASRTQLENQIQRLRMDHLTEIAAAKEEVAQGAAEKLSALENKWQERMARLLAEQPSVEMAEIAKRCQAAEEALALAQKRQENLSTPNEDYVRQLNGEIASLRNNFVDREAELARTHEREAAQFRDAMVRLSGELGIVQDALSEKEASRTQLEDQIQRLRTDHLAQIAAVKEEAAQDAAEKLRVQESKWQDRVSRLRAEQPAAAMTEITARCQAAEEALALAQARELNLTNADDAYVRRLNREIISLQKNLVDREAELARRQTQLEELRLHTATPDSAKNWRPLSNKSGDGEEAERPNHIWRDAAIVFVAVIGAVVAWPQAQRVLTIAGVLGSPAIVDNSSAAPPPQVKPAEPTAIVAKPVKLRAKPTTSGAALASLKSGLKLKILAHDGKWVQVQVMSAGQTNLSGWVYSSFLDMSPAAGH